MKCDNCDHEIPRKVFCSRKCNQEYWNKHRKDPEAPEAPTEKKPLGVDAEKFLHKQKVKYNTSEEGHRPGDFCPKHNTFYLSCGCK